MTSRSLATMAAIALMAPSTARAEERNTLQLVQRFTDAATGAEIRVFKGTQPEVRIEIQAGRFLLRKRITTSAMELKIAAGKDSLDLTLEPQALTVADARNRVRATRHTPNATTDARLMISRSQAVADASTLLARLGLRADSPVYQSILSTRVLLESMTGRRAALEQLTAWHRTLQHGATVRRVSLGQTASECWKEYAKEAIDAWTEYEQCMDKLSWYEIFDALGCALVYDTRALGAFAWWLNCIGVMSPV